MAKNRYINTAFWGDPYIRTLNPEETYLFLYLLTNFHTNIAGIYELAFDIILFETKFKDEKTLRKILNKFEKDEKIYYFSSWVFIRNFQKHQEIKKNDNINKGIKNILNSLPPKVLSKVTAINDISTFYDV